ncbi:MAG: hypothetical protein JWP43_2364, partial [Ramlibacter sp.]|nr:hypothetical protein [Ramlibacter sp.]
CVDHLQGAKTAYLRQVADAAPD